MEFVGKGFCIIFGILLILTVSAILYFPVIYFPFFNYLDQGNITDNPWLKSMHPRNLMDIFLSFKPRFYYQPLVYLSHWIEFRMAGNQAWMYHLGNYLLHLGNILLLLRWLSLIFRKNPLIYLSVLLFALHPIQAETIAWLAGRNELLLGFLVLNFLIQYHLYRTRKKSFLYPLIFLIAACGTHIFAVYLPIVILLLEHTYYKNKYDLSGWKGFKPWKFILLTVFFSLILAIGSFTRHYQYKGGIPDTLMTGSYLQEVLQSFNFIILIFIKQFIYPSGLSPVYTDAFKGINEIAGNVFMLIGIPFILITLFIWGLIRRFSIVFVLALIVFSFISSLHVFHIHLRVYSDQDFYLPLIGIAILIPLFFKGFEEKSGKMYPYFILCVLLLTGFYFIPKTYKQLALWDNPKDVWAHTIKHHPKTFKAYAYYFDACDQSNQFDADLERNLLKGKKYFPERFAINQGLGKYYFYQKEYEKSGDYFINAILTGKNYPESYYLLAQVYLQKGDTLRYIENLKLASFRNYKGAKKELQQYESLIQDKNEENP